MDLWDNMKHNHICMIGIPKGEEGEQGIENLSEDINTNISHLVKKKRHTHTHRKHRESYMN